MREIEQNPFRILGLPITASVREIEKQINTIETYVEMGKTKSFETDFSFLSEVERTSAAVVEAKSKIQLDEQKFFHSLFWFWKNNSVDDLALELLSEGNVDKAIEIWEKAVFVRSEKVFNPVPIIANLIQESDAWSDQNNYVQCLKKLGGEYTIERKIDTGSSISVVQAEFDLDKENWSIECETEWMDGADNAGFGIIFGREDDSYYSFEISGNGYYRFGKLEKGNYKELISWQEFDVIENFDPNHLQIQKIKDTFSFYINGALADVTTSEPLFGSKFGFKVAGKQTITFRKFRFSRLKQDDRYGHGVVVTNKNFSCVKNLSVLLLNQAVENGILKLHIFDKAVILANTFFSSDHVEIYSKVVVGDRFAYDPKKTLTFYLSTLVDSLKTTLDKTYGVTSKIFIEAFTEFPDGTGNQVKEKLVGKTIQDLTKFIEKAQNERQANPGDAVRVGKKLIENAGKLIDHLNDVLGDDDFDYETIADKIADQVVQCGIDYFNATKNDEPCLPLYQYGKDIAATTPVELWAIENYDSCIEWIKNKVYLFCFFCGMNERDNRAQVTKPMYLVTYRSYFPRRVEFSYVDIAIPRCSGCKLLHEQLDSYTFTYAAIIVVCTVVGFFAGVLTTGVLKSPSEFKLGIALLVGVVGLIGGWVAAKKLIAPVDSEGIKEFGEASDYKTVKELIGEGWTFSKPSA